MEKEKLQEEFDELYNKILDSVEDWDVSDLDRLLELNLLINKE